MTIFLIGLTPGDRFAEDRMHERLSAHLVGREWYRPSDAVFAEIVEHVPVVTIGLDNAVAARKHINAAIAGLRVSNVAEAQRHLEAVERLVHEAIGSLVAA